MNSSLFVNSIGMEFVEIPAGSYLRGCNPPFEPCGSDDMPRRRISISSFWLGKYEVTQEQWAAVMGSNPSWFKKRTNPVEQVSWNDVQEFIRKLNAKEGHNRYRLPTEAEWEYAARAGSATVYSFGDEADELGNYAWYEDNSSGQTHSVGQLQPNAWGLYDMHGNVWEWCSDWYNEQYYSSSPQMNDPKGASGGKYHVLRGGGWPAPPKGCRSAFRTVGEPDAHDHIIGLGTFGFRLALSVED